MLRKAEEHLERQRLGRPIDIVRPEASFRPAKARYCVIDYDTCRLATDVGLQRQRI